MNKGISNFQIGDFFKNEETEDLKKKYMVTCSIDSITKYIKFYEIIKRRNGKYPFTIFNTDKENEPGAHRWSFIDIHPKKIYFYLIHLVWRDLNFFIVNNDQDIINELL